VTGRSSREAHPGHCKGKTKKTMGYFLRAKPDGSWIGRDCRPPGRNLEVTPHTVHIEKNTRETDRPLLAKEILSIADRRRGKKSSGHDPGSKRAALLTKKGISFSGGRANLCLSPGGREKTRAA